VGELTASGVKALDAAGRTRRFRPGFGSLDALARSLCSRGGRGVRPSMVDFG